jgi:hypothetical protein
LAPQGRYKPHGIESERLETREQRGDGEEHRAGRQAAEEEKWGVRFPRLLPTPEGSRWPSGDYASLAVLPISESELASRIGLPLVRGVEEGLGPFAAIVGSLPSGAAVEFIRHALAPEPNGVELRTDKGTFCAATLD